MTAHGSGQGSVVDDGHGIVTVTTAVRMTAVVLVTVTGGRVT